MLPLASGACSGLLRDPREAAPPNAAEPWQRGSLGGMGDRILTAGQAGGRSEIDFSRSYGLAELVDLAQTRNAGTRAAWEEARSTAASIGMARSQYYPLLAVVASSGGGYRKNSLKADADLSGLAQHGDLLGALLAGIDPSAVRLDLDSSSAYASSLASLNLKWLLFDFGGRRAKLDAAQKATVAANLRFNASHEKLAYDVTLAYAKYGARRSEVEAARSGFDSAATVLKSVQGKFDQGLATTPELLRAKQVLAEADYGLVTANSNLRLAYVDLAELLTIPPERELGIAALPRERLLDHLEKPLDQYMRDAVRNRPDLLAKLAVVQVREAELRKARSDKLPTLSLQGSAEYSQVNHHVRGNRALDELDVGIGNYGAFLTVQWPLFTGGLDENAIRAAESKHRAAEEELMLSRDKAIAEVWRGYVQSKNALASRNVAEAMLTASRSAYDAALKAYDQGLSSSQDLQLARGAYAKALSVRADADAAILSSFAALALGSGRMGATFPGRSPH